MALTNLESVLHVAAGGDVQGCGVSERCAMTA
jgi:hypothetical protein